MAETILYNDKKIALADPWVPPNKHFAGRREELRKCLAAWRISTDGKTFLPAGFAPLNFRLEGPPGVGKNEIVYEIARRLGQPLYIIQGHEELTPEDMALLLVPDASAESTSRMPIILQASPLASAILKGGLFFFDEINRVPERALSPLASVLDERRSIYSAITGMTIGPLPGNEGKFRFCCALNPVLSEAGRGVLPDYIEERTLPVISVGYLHYDELIEIVTLNLQVSDEFRQAFQDWYQRQTHKDVSVRQAMAVIMYALGLAAHGESSAAKAITESEGHIFRQVQGEVNPPVAEPTQQAASTNKPEEKVSAPEVAPATKPTEQQSILPPPDVNTHSRIPRGLPEDVLGKKFLFEVTGNNDGTVWGSGGNDYYTDDSDIGMAAVHSGILKLGEKKILQVTIVATPDKAYQGSEQNGIESRPYGKWSRGLQFERPATNESSAQQPRFSDRVRKVLKLANEEARDLQHEYVGTEHVLLGLIKEGSGVAANILKNLNLDVPKIRQEVEKVVQPGLPNTFTIEKLPQTPRTKKVIEYSIEEADKLHHSYVGTEHLLLGLLREDEGVAAQILQNLGLKLKDVREGALSLSGQDTEAGALVDQAAKQPEGTNGNGNGQP